MTTTIDNISAPPKPSPAIPRPAKLPSEVLIERGWCRNWIRREGRVCLLGSIAYAPLKQPEIHAITNSLVAVMREKGVNGISEIIQWNDGFWRSFDDVLAVCREAERRLGWRE